MPFDCRPGEPAARLCATDSPVEDAKPSLPHSSLVDVLSWYSILGTHIGAAHRKTQLDHLAIIDRSPPEAKVALFHAIFRGREDVSARRFESGASGKSGYSPACGNQWLRGVCSKPRGKRTTCQRQQYLLITDAVIRWHLMRWYDRSVNFVLGVYPLLLDETCFFLAMDFDKRFWQEDVQSVLATCERVGVPAALEHSRSGAGGHIWVFFRWPCSRLAGTPFGCPHL